MTPDHLLHTLTVVLGTAALTTVASHALRLPVVLGYLVAGFLVGPNPLVPLWADRELVRALSELGVVLLMFSLGLDFSLRKLAKVGAPAAVIATMACSVTGWLGFGVARLFGWPGLETIFVGAVVAISSTTIVLRAFDEQKVRGRLRELVLGILIVQDLIAILLLTALTALASGQNVSGAALLGTLGRLGGFLLALVGIGFIVVPRLARTIIRNHRPEVSLIAGIGLCFALASLAHGAGYSVALGAFLAGSLIAESGEERRLERLVEPVRDVFAAIFFVSVGMLIEPGVILSELGPIAALTGVVLFGQIAGVSVAGFLTGNGVRTSLQAGMSLAQIGEFSFIIAGLGVATGATSARLPPIAVAVSVLTTLATPWLIRASAPTASFIDRKLPHRLQVVASMYGTWVARLGASPNHTVPATRRLARALAVDTALLIGWTIAVARLGGLVVERLQAHTGLEREVAWGLVITLGAVVVLPVCLGIMRNARRIATALADVAFPPREGMDTANAPRSTLLVLIQLTILLLIGLPYMVVTAPFLPGAESLFLLALLLLVPLLAFWRSAADLHGHIQAGAQLIVEVVAKGGVKRGAAAEAEAAHRIATLLPGLGEPTPFVVDAGSPAEGHSLAALNLRGQTGATVLAIVRGEHGVLVPSAGEVLQRGDILALAGTAEAVRAARALLSGEGVSDVDAETSRDGPAPGAT
ncbi:cation:proton antiporter [Myxococcota bacterium]|nr:cation:proton antiporter [Myxococcota bacterium]